MMWDHRGEEVTAEDILGDDREELAAYRRIHPRPVVHQLRFFPDPGNACDECQADLGANQGGICGTCADRLWFERGDEWWSE